MVSVSVSLPVRNVCVSATPHLTTRVIIRTTNKLTYSAVDDGQQLSLKILLCRARTFPVVATVRHHFLLREKCAWVGHCIMWLGLISETFFGSFLLAVTMPVRI